jgi:hypothetical protein
MESDIPMELLSRLTQDRSVEIPLRELVSFPVGLLRGYRLE